MVFENHGKFFAHWNVLQSIAKQRQIDHYLEVGVCRGESLRALLEVQFPDRLTLCDSWGGESGGESFGGPSHIKELLRSLKYPNTVEFLNGNSHELLKTLLPESFDLILVDGDHSKEGARKDLEDCWPLLMLGGLLVFDDLDHPSHPELLQVYRAFTHRVNADVVYEDLQNPMGVGVLCKTS